MSGLQSLHLPGSRLGRVDCRRKPLDAASDPAEALTATSRWTNLNTFSNHGGKLIFFHGVSFPRSVLLIDLIFTILAVGGVRLVVRIFQETPGRYVARKKTLIVGAGAAGSAMARALRSNPVMDRNPVGFVAVFDPMA